MTKKTKKTKKPGRFVVYKLASTGRSNRTLARFHDRTTACSFARAESIDRETTVYVDEILGRNQGEPIATYSSGMSVRI